MFVLCALAMCWAMLGWTWFVFISDIFMRENGENKSNVNLTLFPNVFSMSVSSSVLLVSLSPDWNWSKSWCSLRSVWIRKIAWQTVLVETRKTIANIEVQTPHSSLASWSCKIKRRTEVKQSVGRTDTGFFSLQPSHSLRRLRKLESKIQENLIHRDNHSHHR